MELTPYLERASAVILPTEESMRTAPLSTPPEGRLHVGVDLGTAYIVLAVLDDQFQPIAGEYQFAQVVRDGLVVDFMGATDILRAMKSRVEGRIGRKLAHAASGFPPGVPRAEVRATANVLEAAGMHCTHLIAEPSAANAVIGLQRGAIVDVGGGTTGIAVIEQGKVVFTADEATGGTHFTLVIAGAQNIEFEQAEALKTNPAEHARLLPTVRPVMEKVGNIVSHQLAGRGVDALVLVGGTSAFTGMAQVVEQYTGIATQTPALPMFVTPLGFALHDVED